MRDTHEVILLPEARGDIAKIVAYIRYDSRQNAANVGDRLLAAISSLSHMPGRFKQVGRSRARGSPVHAMVVNPFVVYYRIDPDEVYVLHVQHGARRRPRKFE